MASSVGVGTCFSIFSFWLHVAAVTITVAIIDWPEFDVLLMALYRTGIMLWRTFRSGRIRIMYSCKDTEERTVV